MRSLLTLLLLIPVFGRTQNAIGLPDVVNYSKQVYRAGLQSWDITQDSSDILYFANNEGLLRFDGRYWDLFPLPNKTIVRSSKLAADGLIYVGGQDEVGYFQNGPNGRLVYQSLVDLIPAADRSFGDVWHIAVVRGSVFFRTTNRIFRLSGQRMSVYRAPSEWSFMGECRNRLYAHDFQQGLLVWEDEVWKPAAGEKFLGGSDPVTGLLPLGIDTVLVTTLKSGLFLLHSGQATPLRSAPLEEITRNRIYHACSISPNWAALATSNGGVHIIDGTGRVIQHFTRTEGLQNNNVLCVFSDRHGNLWLGLDNGIDFIAFSSAIKRVIPGQDDGAGYSASLFGNRLYAGTSGGLFQVPLEPVADFSFSRGSFRQVANTSGQTWSLSVINNRLLLGHHEGMFDVTENAATRLAAPLNGVWNFTPLSGLFPTERMVAGHYKGLSFFRFEQNKPVPDGVVADFNESSRYVVRDENLHIWVSHPYHGVTRISPAGSTRLYTQREGLPTTLNNHIFKIRNELVVATEQGIYRYNPAKDHFEPHPLYGRYPGSLSLRYLKEDAEGNIWFIHEKSLGVINITGPDTTLLYLPELSNKLLSGFEFIYPVNPQNIFVGSERGFFHINYDKYRRSIPALRLHLRSVRIGSKQDSLLFGGYFTQPGRPQFQDRNQVPRIVHSAGSIRFEYAAPLYAQAASLEYSYRLKGVDENWSDWSSKTDKEYTHLPAGNYRFEVKVRNNLGNESEPLLYEFVILPPWYQTLWAYIIYGLLVAAGLFYLYKWQRKKFIRQQTRYEEEQKRLQYLHQLEMNKAEKELVSLRNEKLQADIDFKNAELAQSAMHLVQKGELISRIRHELNQLIKGLNNEKATGEIRKIIRVLGEDDKMDKDWEHFAQHFDKVHSDFVVALKEKHTSLTPNEVKLCAYLRMNLTSKEIAQLMNISVRGVEISRYRLRKKLGIETEMTLFDYLIRIGPGKNSAPESPA